MTQQLKLLDNIEYFINRLKKQTNFTKEFYDELMPFLDNNILQVLSRNKINFDLSLLKKKFNINVNIKLLKNKNLFFLYEYIMYNVFKNDTHDNIFKLMFGGIFDLHLYDNVMYLNKFHLFNNGKSCNIMTFVGILNLYKAYDEYYIYTDSKITKEDISTVFNINYSLNFIHIYNKIYINDKLFLDYIDIPNNISIQYPNVKVYNDYFKSLGIIYKSDVNFIYITNNKFKNIKPYSNPYNYLVYFNFKNYETKGKTTKEELDYFSIICKELFLIYKKYKNKYKSFPFNEFKKIKYYNSQLHKEIIDYLYPNLKLVDKEYHKEIIKQINIMIIKIFKCIKE